MSGYRETEAELFCRVGSAMYGGNWKLGLAADLGVRQSSVQNWANGRNPLRPDIWKSVVGVIDERAAELRELRQRAMAEAMAGGAAGGAARDASLEPLGARRMG